MFIWLQRYFFEFIEGHNIHVLLQHLMQQMTSEAVPSNIFVITFSLTLSVGVEQISKSFLDLQLALPDR